MRRLPGSLAVSVLLFLTAAGLSGQDPGPDLDEALRGEVKAAIDRGLGFLRWSQGEDGSWGGDLPLTALALRAFTDSHRGYREADGPFIRSPLAYIRQSADQIGPFQPGDTSRLLDVAAVATALEPFVGSEPGAGDEIGWDYYLGAGLISQDQFQESPDIFLVAHVVEALRVLGGGSIHPRPREIALQVLARLQDTTGEWGFVADFESGRVSEDATAMGLFALTQAGVGVSDVRAAKALDWLQQRYDLKGIPDSDRFYRYSFELAHALHGPRPETR